ncbi:Peptide methionine sulfoxide reductase MsrA [Sodalis praecaptivus]
MAQNFDKTTRITQSEALPGRMTPMPIAPTHPVLHHSMSHVPDGMAFAIFAMGCFWGVERLFWQQPGVYSTAAGYTGGYTPNPTYREVCSGQTGHAEAVRVVFDPQIIPYTALLGLFWQHHNPTQGMRQGTISAANTAWRSFPRMMRSARPRAQAWRLLPKPWPTPAIPAPSRPPWNLRRPFIMPRMSINNIYINIPTAIAPSGALACACRRPAKRYWRRDDRRCYTVVRHGRRGVEAKCSRQFALAGRRRFLIARTG